MLVGGRGGMQADAAECAVSSRGADMFSLKRVALWQPGGLYLSTPPQTCWSVYLSTSQRVIWGLSCRQEANISAEAGACARFYGKAARGVGGLFAQGSHRLQLPHR